MVPPGLRVTSFKNYIFQVFSDTPMVWWWKSRFGGGGRASGTFIGSNHFAGYLEMLIPLVFGFMLAQKRQKTEVRKREEGEKSRSRRSKRIIQGFRDKGSEVDPQITQIKADYEKDPQPRLL